MYKGYLKYVFNCINFMLNLCGENYAANASHYVMYKFDMKYA